mmetsp:Transcript_47598/g.90846  ORF Transcript_47598/g.90846 Transcript_47598/m.90846 type:complete len:427 (-) Transcript_47598:263-1543(-)
MGFSFATPLEACHKLAIFALLCIGEASLGRSGIHESPLFSASGHQGAQSSISAFPDLDRRSEVVRRGYAGAMTNMGVPLRGRGAWREVSNRNPRPGRTVRPEETTANYELYERKYEADRGRKCSGCKHLRHIHQFYPTARTILDAGAGQCKVVRNLTASGLEAYGTEMSRASLDLHCSDLVRIGRVKQATLDSIPFNNNQFDLVFSSEVLEHVPEHMVDAAVKELARVSRGKLFLTISLRRSKMDPPSPEVATVHVTVKTRAWWDSKFAQQGCVRNQMVYSSLQQRIPRSQLTENMRRGCIIKKVKGQECWKDGELEPWYFPYDCARNDNSNASYVAKQYMQRMQHRRATSMEAESNEAEAMTYLPSSVFPQSRVPSLSNRNFRTRMLAAGETNRQVTSNALPVRQWSQALAKPVATTSLENTRDI